MCELHLTLSPWASSGCWLGKAQVWEQHVASSSSHPWGQQITQKRRHFSTKPHGFTSQQKLIFILTTQKENTNWNAGRSFYRTIGATASRLGRSVSEYSTIRYNCRSHVRSEVPVAVTRQIACVFCDAILHNLEGVYRYFGRTCFLHIQWENGTEDEDNRIFQMSIRFYQTTRDHILESCIVFLVDGNHWRWLGSFNSQHTFKM
jgi:hypothetical protein